MYELRDYQKEACAAVWDYLRAESGHPIIVLPTGAGKSLCIAELCRQAVAWDGKVLVVAHRKELLQQNAEKIQALIPEIKVGIYSAGLKQRDTSSPVVCCGIQSVWKRALEFGARKLVIVDECHLVPNDKKSDAMYARFLRDLETNNQWCKRIGLTATPYRLSDGLLVDGDLWDCVAYTAQIRRLIDAGYLSPLVHASTSTVNLDDVKLRGKEYIASQMQGAFMQAGLVESSVREIVSLAADRKKILVFGCGVEHAQAVADEIMSQTGQDARTVTGETPSDERAETIESFRSGDLRWLVNMDVLTTGFDSPNIDCIAALRGTQSPGLFAQICGRGFRRHPGKTDCLLLDFGGNLARFGPLDSPKYGTRNATGPATPGENDAPLKTCPKCSSVQPVRARWCDDCGFDFPLPEGHEKEADKDSPILMKPETFYVEGIEMGSHHKAGKPTSLRVDYFLPNITPNRISEWICLEHTGFARVKAEKWWQLTSNAATPETVEEAITLFRSGALRLPRRITAIKDGRFWRITDYEFEEEKPETWRKPSDDFLSDVKDVFEAEELTDKEIPF